MFYKTCPDCGAALDPGEHCDCQTEEPDNDNAQEPSAETDRRKSA